MNQQPQPYPLPPENPQRTLSPVRSGPFAARNAESRYAEHLRSLHELIESIASDVTATKVDFEDLSTRSRDNGQALERLMSEIKGVREDDGVSQKLTGLAQLDHLQKLDKLKYLGKLNKLDTIEETLRGLGRGAPPANGAEQLNQLEKLGQLSLLEHLKKLQSLDQIESRMDKLQELDRLQQLDQLDQLKELGRLQELDRLQDLRSLEHLKQLEQLSAISRRRESAADPQMAELKALHIENTKQLERLPSIEAQLRANGLDQSTTLASLMKQLEELGQTQSVESLRTQVEALQMREHAPRQEYTDQFASVEQLQRSHASSLDALREDQAEHLGKIETQLKELGSLKVLPELDRNISQVVSSMDELPRLKDISKLDELQHLGRLEALDKLQTLDQLSSLSMLEQLSLLEELKSLGKIEQLDQLSALDKLGQLSEMKSLQKLERLDELDKLSALEELKKLDSLKGLSSLGQIEDIRGEVRAVQDHLLGMHEDAVTELSELRKFKESATPVLELNTEAEKLEARVNRLRAEESALQQTKAALAADIKHGVSRLEDCETRYARLEARLRDLTLAKYKGILGTGTMAVLSKNQGSDLNKENDIVMPKRQLRTVSLANH